MREIVLDTETTGLDALRGDRLVEIGCVELLNHIPTGETFHVYLNPERDMPEEAFRVHGLSFEFLKDKPLFADVADAFIAFIGDAPLIIHNASFDIGFINAELDRAGLPKVPRDRLIDTVVMARRRFPNASNSLDALCARFGVDSSRRTRHGALLDAELLAEVYIELIGGRQASLVLAAQSTVAERAAARRVSAPQHRPVPLASRFGEAEMAAHQAFVAELGPKALWLKYRSEEASDAASSK